MDGFELYSLTSKLTLDTSQFDRAYNDSRTKMRTLAGEVNKLEAAAKSGGSSISGGLGSALNGLMPSLTSLGGPAGAISIVTTGVTLMVGALAAAAAGVWSITSRFSDLGSALQDMSDQVNFSVETLGTFEGVGKSIGVEVEQLSTGLVTFQKNLAGGNDALKALGVTSKDGETALRETLKALSMVNDKTLQTALAQEIFGKSGKAMMAVVKATGGDFDAAQEKLREWNVLMSDDAIAIADEFGDKLGELGLRLQGIGNTIATETAPAFIAAFDQISAALDASEIDWQWWGQQVGNIVVSSTAIIAGFIKAVQSMSFASGPGAFIMVWKEAMDQAIAEMNAKRGELLAGSGGAMGGRVGGPTIDWKPGGKDKEKKGAREKEDPIIRMMERYADQLRTLTPLTVEQEIRQELLGKAYEKSSAELKAALIVTGMAIDVKKKEIEAEREAKAERERAQTAYSNFAKQQAETLRQLRDGTMSAFQEAQVAMLEFLSVTTPVQRWWLEFDAILIDIERHLKELPGLMVKVAEQENLNKIIFPTTPESENAERAGEAANKEMGLPPEMRESTLLKWRRLIDDLAYDITHTIDRAITRGFEDGIGAGIREFALGILEMAKHEALNELAQAIRRALGGGGAGEEQGGGGLLSTVIKTGVGLIAGLFGGGAAAGGLGAGAAGAIGGKAGGGFMFPNEWGWVGERGPELIRAGSRGASVMSNQESMAFAGMGGGVTFNVWAQDASSFGSRQTQRQLTRKMRQVQGGR